MSSNDRAYACAVTRGVFSYYPYQNHPDQALRVNDVQRCPSDRLYALLTWQDTGPTLRKDGKPKVHQPPKYRDENQQFYIAQCVHYGLKPWKTKSAAKKELLKAFGNGREIAIPRHILELEQELQEEYAAANVLAKEDYEEQKRARADVERSRLLKMRRQDAELLKEVRDIEMKRNQQARQLVLELDKIAAHYTVVAPDIYDNWGSLSNGSSYSLAVAPSPSGTEVYGEFDFGIFEGYLRSTSIDKINRTIMFHWRGRDTGEGESTFSEDNVMRITFLDDKTFEGDAEGEFFQRCDIVGRHDAENSRNMVFRESVPYWKGNYENLDEYNYGRERVARWH